jgi:hypothetical protein
MNPQVCGSEFTTKGCQCLTDPMDPTNYICAYVNRQNGIVYPCDIGCCTPICGTKPGQEPRKDIEFRQTFGGALPPGFNENLATSAEPTKALDFESKFEPIPDPDLGVPDALNSLKVMNVATKIILAILLILFFAVLLT